MARDYYDVLGVGREADGEAIKRAFRSRAREFHPDVSSRSDAPERFREVSEAYEVLADERARTLYDRLGWRGRGRPWTLRRGVARVYASNPRAFLDDLEALLAAAMGRRSPEEKPRVVAEVEIDAYDAYLGTTRTVTIPEPRPCPACGGQRRRAAVMDLEGARLLTLDDCAECGGTGELGAFRDVDIVIPARTKSSDTIPVAADGVAAVRVVAADDAVFVRIAASAWLLVAVGFLLYLLAL